MDHIREIIQTFNSDDVKEFKLFANRSRKKDHRMDLELFLILAETKEYSREEILEKLYPEDKNIEAYHATRKRLIKQIQEFVYLKEIKEDHTLSAQIESLLAMCKFLFKNKKDESGWVYLKKAIDLSSKCKNYGLLNQCYQLGIVNSLCETALPIEELIEQKSEVQRKVIEEEKAKTANFLIQHEVHRALENGENVDYHQTVKKILKEYDLQRAVEDNPRLFFDIIDITRKVSMTKKDFSSFEAYVVKRYQKLEKSGVFNKFNHQYKVNILYYICHVYYRNQKFRDAELYLEKFHSAIFFFGESHLKAYYQKYILLKSNIFIYTGRLDPAIATLEASLNHPLSRMDRIQLLNTHVVLSVAYFFKEEYEKSLNTFMKVNHSEKWCLKVMGKEWLMKKYLLDVMSQYELGHTDIVENRIRTILRKFSDLFEQEAYQRVRSFVVLVNRVNNNPHLATSTGFKALVQESFDWRPKELEDIQAITFYAWLKSKMKDQPYYETLLQLIND